MNTTFIYKNSIQRFYKSWNLSTEKRIIVILAVLKFLIHLFTSTNYEFHCDELLFISESKYPDTGYFSIPPLIPLLTWLITSLLGDSIFVIKLFPAILGTLSLIITCLITLELGGKRIAVLIVGLSYLISAYLFFDSILSPIPFDILFWILSTYFLIKMLKQNESRYWIHLGITWGLAFLNKYSIVFFALSAFISILLTSKRRLIFNRKFLIALCIGILITIPNIIWQYQHNWPVLFHMAELQRTQLANVNILDFLLDQIVFVLSGLVLWSTGLISLLFSKEYRQFRILSFTYILVMVSFAILKGKNYYSLGIYPMLMAVGAVVLERSKNIKKIILFTLYLVFFLISILELPYGIPVFSLNTMDKIGQNLIKTNIGMLRWNDGRLHSIPQYYADMTGWEQLARKVIKEYQSLDRSEQKKTHILTDWYGPAGAIQYYGSKHGLPNPICLNDNFLLQAPDSLAGEIFIIASWRKDLDRMFNSVSLVDSVVDKYSTINNLPIYLCINPNKLFTTIYSESVNFNYIRFNRDYAGKLRQIENLAENKKYACSSVESDKPNYRAKKAFDNNLNTRWSSNFSDPQWISIDLLTTCSIHEVVLFWESSFGREYHVEISKDGRQWEVVYSTNNSNGVIDKISLSSVKARYIRMFGVKRARPYGYSLWEFRVHGSSDHQQYIKNGISNYQVYSE